MSSASPNKATKFDEYKFSGSPALEFTKSEYLAVGFCTHLFYNDSIGATISVTMCKSPIDMLRFEKIGNITVSFRNSVTPNYPHKTE